MSVYVFVYVYVCVCIVVLCCVCYICIYIYIYLYIHIYIIRQAKVTVQLYKRSASHDAVPGSAGRPGHGSRSSRARLCGTVPGPSVRPRRCLCV